MLKTFVRSNILILIIGNSANFINYLVQFVVSRYMTPADFGIFNAVSSLGVIASSALAVIPYVAAKFLIEMNDDVKQQSLLLNRFSWVLVRWGGGLAVLMGLVSPLLADYLQLPSVLPVFIVVLTIFTSLHVTLFIGTLQGLLHYVSVSWKLALHSFTRFALTLLLVVWLGYGYNGALWASALTNIVVFTWLLYVVTRHLSLKRPEGVSLPDGLGKKMLRYTVPAGLTWLAIGALVNIDMVLVKHFVSADEAGLYSVAALIGRIAVFLPGILLIALFPQVIKNESRGEGSLSSLLVTLFLTLLIVVVFSFLVGFFPEAVVGLLFGVKYGNAGGVLLLVTLLMSVVALLSVLFNFFLAKSIYGFLYPSFAGIFLSVAAVNFFYHASAYEIVVGLLVGFSGTLLANILFLFWHYRDECLRLWNRSQNRSVP